MKHLFTVLFLSMLIIPLYAADGTYLANVECDPSHCNLNYDGSVTISFDLPGLEYIDEAHFEIQIGGTYYEMEGSLIDGSDLDSFGNEFTITGQMIERAVSSTSVAVLHRDPIVFPAPDEDMTDDADTEYPDEDTENDSDDGFFDEDAEVPDEDIDDSEITDTDDGTAPVSSEHDGTYTVKLVLTMIEDDGDSGDSETSDDDTESSGSIPDTTEETLSVVYDNDPPDAVDLVTSEGGDRTIYFTVAPPEDEEIGAYIITLTGSFEKDGEETEDNTELTWEKSVSSDDSEDTVTVPVGDNDGYRLINSGEDDSHTYTAKVYAEDLAGNSSPDTATVIEASAVATSGFWSSYNSEGGKDDGGYCFIATAAWGSYFHPRVTLLRHFRDTVLMKTSVGRTVVDTYYDTSPPLADFIRSVPALRGAVRVLLSPLTVIAYCIVNPLVGLLMLLLFCIPLLFMIPRAGYPALLLPILILLLLLLLPESAHAREAEKKSFTGDLSFNSSLFYPGAIDAELTGSPFRDIAGRKVRYLPAFRYGVDIPLLRKYMKLTVRTGIGYTNMKGKCLMPDGTRSRDKTAFHIIPLVGEVRLRPEYPFPLKPFIAGGFDYIFWWINEKGTRKENGGTMGFHGNFGLQFELSWLEKRAARRLREMTGIIETSLFAHYRLEKIDDFSKTRSIDLSNHRFEFGILFEY